PPHDCPRGSPSLGSRLCSNTPEARRGGGRTGVAPARSPPRSAPRARPTPPEEMESMRPSSIRKLVAGAVGLVATALIGVAPVHAQAGGNITGVVTNQATNQPVASAQIFIAGSQRGGLTNQQGRYLLANIPAGEHEVRATLIGFSQASARVTVAPGETVQLDLQLSESAITLGAVIVTATGAEQRTREIGNAVSSINVADMPLASTPTMT